MLELWHFHRRALVIGGLLLTALIVVLAVASLIVRVSGPATRSDTRRLAERRAPAAPAATPVPSAAATDVAEWDAIAAVTPATSSTYQPIARTETSDPSGFAQAFVTELFTRDYSSSTRQELISWAQYEDAPLRSPNYPEPDWSKVLVDSLTDLTWDQATDTPIPADGPWLALRSERATQSVSNVQVRLDPQWERQIADGYEPPDPMTTVRDVSFTITEQTHITGRPETSRYEASLAVQLGTSPRGGYGAAATNNYVLKAVH